MTVNLEEETKGVEAMATILNFTAEASGAGGGCIIAALTMLLAVRLDEAPASARDEIRRRVVRVIEGKPDVTSPF